MSHRPLRRRPARRLGAAPRPAALDRPTLLRHAASWSLDECLANDDWRERGLAVVIFVRRSRDGRRAAAAFVVDLFCRGVREVRVVLAGVATGLAAVHDLVEDLGIPGRMRRVDPHLGAKIVRSGSDYAATLGFAPHRDFAWARAIFDGIDTSVCTERVPCGRFGKPVVVAEPGADLRALVDRLERRVGRGGFHLVAPLETVPEG